MPLDQTQEAIALSLSYEPMTSEEAEQPAELTYCNLTQRKAEDGWTEVLWRGRWYRVPTMGELEDWVFDSLCETPDGRTVESDHPQSWLTILGMI